MSNDVWYLYADPIYFEDIGCAPYTDEYFNLLRGYLSDEWEITKNRIWLYVSNNEIRLPAQGFKIHVSAVPSTATRILEIVAKICSEYKIPFKAIADPSLLLFLCSKRANRGASGKFITIYPPHVDIFKAVINKLDADTKELDGPYILSDRRYENSKVIYYRYGGFANISQLNIDGTKKTLIYASNGEKIEDVRAASFRLPEGIKDPVSQKQSKKYSGEIKLHDRFVVKQVITYSNAGGIYISEDLSSSNRVLLKEARPNSGLVGKPDNYVDAPILLRNEALILAKLVDVPYVPKIIESFKAWEHDYIAVEYLEGYIPLSRYRATTGMLIGIRHRNNKQQSNRLNKFRKIAKQILEAVRLIHSCGVVIGDISSNNVLIDPKSLEVKLIDFEGSTCLDKTHIVPAEISSNFYTPGYARDIRIERGFSEVADDWYAVGMLLFYALFPIDGFAAHNENKRKDLLQYICDHAEIPKDIKCAIECLWNNKSDDAEEYINRGSPSEHKSQHRKTSVSKESADVHPATNEILQDASKRITRHIQKAVDLTRTDRLWPTDYLVFGTNPMNIAVGAGGPLLYLKQVENNIPDRIIRHISKLPVTSDDYPPGLFMGSAGVSLLWLMLNDIKKAEDRLLISLTSPLLKDNPTFYYGAAGIGFSCLSIFNKTKDSFFLKRAEILGHELIKNSKVTKKTRYWVNSIDKKVNYGFALGSSGIGLFLLQLSAISGDNAFRVAAEQAMQFDLDHKRIFDNRIEWPRFRGDRLYKPYWFHGTAGVATATARFALITGKDKYLDIGAKSLLSIANDISVWPGLFEGQTGVGEALLDYYALTNDEKYMRYARVIASRVLKFSIEKGRSELMFPGRFLVRMSTDYAHGSSGIGIFFSRILTGSSRQLHDLPGIAELSFAR